MLTLGYQAQRRATVFEAALPIAAPSLYIARALAIFAGLLIPALAASASILAFGGAAASSKALAPVEMTSFCTLQAAMMLSVQPRLLSGPRWLFFVLYLPIILLAMWAAKSHVVGLAAMVCAAITLALVLTTWAKVPKTFKIGVDRGFHFGRSSRETAGSWHVAWGPVLRSVFSGVFLLWLLFLPGGCLRGEWINGIVCLPFLWIFARVKTRWLWALPVKSWQLLATIIAPILFMLLVGYLAGFHFGKHSRPVPDARTMVVNAACIVGCVFLVMTFIALMDWRRLRRIASILRPIWIGLAAVLPMVGLALLKPGASQEIALRLSNSLPSSLYFATALLAASLAVLYWALNRVFEESEFTDKQVTKKDIDSMWGR
jgi:hypothetical protein